MPLEINRMSPSSPSSRPLQRHPRTLFSVPITLRYLAGGGIRTSRGISLDLSESGVGALVEGGLEVGETVGIELKLPGREFTTVAIVRHSCNSRSGFEFVGLTSDERARLAGMAAKA